MFGKRMRFLTMLVAAGGIPYAWFNENLAGTIQSTWNQARQTVSQAFSATASSGSAGGASLAVPTIPPAEGSRSALALAAVPTGLNQQLPEVLRFDVSPRWVTDRWPRISTVRAERDLIGLRVPLVTGTALGDIAGSLTYYFDAQQRLVRLRMHGQTGDERELVNWVTQRFGLRSEPNLTAGVYILRWNTRPLNVLRVRLAPVVRDSTPYSNYQIDLEVNDVAAGYGMSSEFAEILASDQHVRRFGS